MGAGGLPLRPLLRRRRHRHARRPPRRELLVRLRELRSPRHVVTAPLAILTWQSPTLDEWIALGATALFAIGAQLLLTFSLRWVDAMTVGVISQLAVLVSMALGATFLNEHITSMAALRAHCWQSAGSWEWCT